MEEDAAPLSPRPDLPRRGRWKLVFKGLVDVLLSSSVLLVTVVLVVTAHEYLTLRAVVDRENLWRFETLPADDGALLAWARSQPDLRNFRVQRREPRRELVLRYERTGRKGPARPNWGILGYRMAYLASAPSLEYSPVPALWLGSLLAYPAIAGIAALRMKREFRAGTPLVLPTCRPQRGWWRWLLAGFAIFAATNA